MGTTGKSFLQFQVSRRADLSRIARKSGGEHSADDAGVEAWLIASDIERKRGFPIDFSNREDQDLLLSWLYRELVSFSERTVRFAVKLDRHWQEDSEYFTNSLEGLLVAPDQFDPLLQLQAKQEQSAALELVKRSYSQAAAYVILLCRCDWDLEAVAGYLRLVASTVKNRLLASGVHMRFQPSLFDKIQTVEQDFAPTVARGTVRSPVQELGQCQLALQF